jgi:ribosomal protein S18 acetylase RimI-like enzyme
MLVNTEPTNAAALALYRSLGFDVLPDSFVVMERAVNVAAEVSA